MKSKWSILVLFGILMLIAAPAAASPPTPFLISGWVNDRHGDPVNDPAVVVTSTDEEFVVKTNVSSNYYQAMTDSDNVSAGDVLGFSVNGDTAINHTVTDEISAGGFGQNLTVPIQIPGDVNGDGYLTTADAAIVLQMAVRGECPEVADVSGDGIVTSLDALMILQAAGPKDNLVTLKTDKTMYGQGESVNITVRNGLNYTIVVGVESGCKGTVFYVQKFDNGTWTTLATVCGRCLMAISDGIGSMSSKVYEWNQTVYADRADCGSGQQVSEGLYRIKMRYYYSAKLIYDNAYSDNFTIVADDENSASIGAISGDANEYKILLKSRRFVPEPGIDPDFESELSAMADAGVERAHVLMQFYDMPNTSERAVLYKDFGVELQTYIPNNAWFTDIPCKSVSDIVALPNVRWIGKILPDDKISPHIRDCDVGSWAVNPDGTVNLLAMFFDDISNDDATSVIGKYGNVAAEPSPWGGNVWTIMMNESDIAVLANEDAVQWIEPVPPPKTTHNDGSSAAVGANTAQAPPYDLQGDGVVIAEWDGGWADWNHNDLSGRVTVGDAGGYVADHAWTRYSSRIDTETMKDRGKQ